jgi:predicted metal-binding membrane protein
MGMSVSMAAMMAPTAAPFFFAYGRHSRRLLGVALLVLTYLAIWAVVGAGADLAMGQMMLPSSWMLAVAAIAFAAVYSVTPWSRWARARCRAMCGREARSGRLADAVRDGFQYGICCVVCSAGVMVAAIALGMSNPVVFIAAMVLILALKLTSWPARALSSARSAHD